MSIDWSKAEWSERLEPMDCMLNATNRDVLVDFLLQHVDLSRGLPDYIMASQCACGVWFRWETIADIPRENVICSCGHKIIIYDEAVPA